MPGPTPAKYGPATDLWPARTPTRAEALNFPPERQATVAFDPADIVDALKGFTDAQWDIGVVVWTEDGTAAPGGAGAGSAIWIDYGRTGRKRRALVMPKNPWGSCTFSKSVRIRMPGVAFGGYEFNATNYALGVNRGILLSDMTEGAIFNMGKLWYWGVQSSDNKPTSGVELCNLSIPESTLKRYVNNNMDVAAIRSGANASISGIQMTGLHVAPAFHETPKTEEQRKKPSHTDSCQVSGNSLMSNFRWKRSIIYGSTNAAIQSTGALTGYHFEDVLVVGGGSTNTVFPLPEDAVSWTPDGSGRVKPNALNGGPTGCTATRLVVIGTVGSFDFLWQKDSVLSEAPQSSQQPSSGAQWAVDTSLASKPKSWFLAQAPEQTREYLKAVYDNAEVAPPSNQAPTAFALSQPVVTTTSAALEWTASTDPEGTAIKYEVERNGVTVADGLTGLTYRDSALLNGTQYQYQVFAVDAADQRTGSNIRTVTTGADNPGPSPDAPVLSLSELKPTSGRISWTASAGASGYDIMSGAITVKRVGPAVLSFELTGLTPEEEYSVFVVAWSSSGRVASNVITATTPSLIDRTPPTVFTVSAESSSPGKLVATATRAEDPTGQAITYEWLFDGKVVPNSRSTSRTYTWTGLNQKTALVQAVARDTDDNSRSSAQITATVTPLDQEAPASPRLDYTKLEATSVTLVGTAAATPGDVVRYELRRGQDVIRGGKTIAEFAAVAQTLVEKTNYQYSFVAIDAAENESDPAFVSFRSPAIKAVLPTNWFEIDTLVRDAVSLANGEVEVAYSHELVTEDGVTIFTAPQVFRISDGRLLDDQGQPVKFYRSPDLRHWIEWRPRLLLDGRKVAAPPRKFTIPQTAANGFVHFYDLAFEAATAPPAGVTSWGFGPPTSLFTSYYDISGPKPVLYLYGSPA